MFNVIVSNTYAKTKLNLAYITTLFIYLKTSTINIVKWPCGFGRFVRIWLYFSEGISKSHFIFPVVLAAYVTSCYLVVAQLHILSAAGSTTCLHNWGQLLPFCEGWINPRCLPSRLTLKCVWPLGCSSLIHSAMTTFVFYRQPTIYIGVTESWDSLFTLNSIQTIWHLLVWITYNTLTQIRCLIIFYTESNAWYLFF